MRIIKIDLPFTTEVVRNLNVGDKLLLSGKILTARDAAHKRMVEQLPLSSINYSLSTIYYCGPTPAKPGYPIGACGPTTSGRMDSYVTQLFPLGYKYMIGKGDRSDIVKEMIVKYEGLYLVAIGGAGALYGRCVTHSRCIAWEDLGAEAVYELDVRDFPCYVGIDCRGRDICQVTKDMSHHCTPVEAKSISHIQ